MSTPKKTAPKAPKAPAKKTPIVDVEPVAPELTVEVTEELKTEWEEHLNDPNAERSTFVEVELANVLQVKNQKGKQFTVSKAYYLANKHKLTISA